MLARCLRTSLCVALSVAAVSLASPACAKHRHARRLGRRGHVRQLGRVRRRRRRRGLQQRDDVRRRDQRLRRLRRGVGSCSGELNACNMSLECRQYGQCIEACAQGDDACVSDCASRFPVGSSKYKALLDCVVCKQCLVQCDGVGAGCGE